MNNKQISLLIVVALSLIAFAFGTASYLRDQDAKRQQMLEVNRDALSREHAPIYGSLDAKVRITEFFDPACETCRAFYPLVKQMVDESRGRVQLVVRLVPFHAGSDLAARILVAAHEQQKFIPVVEVVLRTQDSWASHAAPNPELLWGFVESAGLEVERARVMAASAKAQTVIAQDMADAKTLQVTRTPGFFVNGKPLENFGEDQLRSLVRREVDDAYSKP
ncbi:Thioredoxin [Xylophilus ampelinus]|uniref:Disulfide bond formation protein DsbA n=1 Tax=Variovorax paradoxus TaxID=34073 RepID=A0A2W5QLS0_VARPD|nr:thioredoxin domain-containing protein [Variovorax sp.]PZQ77896.1 MAG: disulfide bond formation protein DsbA [Variovorax paradoxus]VTY37662.1 Thioredoxin [Xylophilus ampelinus]|tara:strand:+ start:1495 stop:2157 length:663 start_codon:yes stop_codon:yes gene_type:complete